MSQNQAMQQAAYAQSISPMNFGQGTANPGTYGRYSEQLAHGGAQNMMGAASLGMGAMSVAGGMGMLGRAGHMLDPFSIAMSAGRSGMGVGRMMGMGTAGALGMGAMATGGVALGMYGAYKGVSAYTGAFNQGMNEQAALNSTLRQNFGHFGGNGSMGRGFSMREMGSIGGMVSSELKNNPMTSAGELNSLIGQGAQSGMFTGVKEVQDFSKNFKKMLHTLKEVQKELGGSLSESMKFIESAKQSGVFQQVDQLRYAAGMRTAEATSGLSRGELMGLSAQGAQVARGVGGLGRQGAMGALRGAAQLGAAVSAGVINEETLSEMTGGLTGASALQGATMQLMQSNARFTRRTRGRYTIFGLSNAQGTGMDADALDDLASGNMSTGQLAGRAHRNVRGMGRARAVNQEGHLRGAFLEEAGFSGQVALLRSRIGNRVLDGGDERIQAYLRRTGMGAEEAQVSTAMLRNAGTIQSAMLTSSRGSARATAISQDAEQYQSMDAFKRELGHGLSNVTGVTAARDMGRRFLTSLSSITERAMSDLLGGVERGLSARDNQAVNSFATGSATNSQLARVAQMSRGGGTSGPGNGGIDINYRGGALMTAAHAMTGHGGRRSIREVFEARGMDASSMSQVELRNQISQMQLASHGTVTGVAANAQLARLSADPVAAAAMIAQARSMSRATTGHSGAFAQFTGGLSANVIDAHRARMGLTPDDQVGAAQMYGQGTQHLTLRNLVADSANIGRRGLGGSIMTAAYNYTQGRETGFASLDSLIGERDRSITGLGATMTRMSDVESFARNGGGELLAHERGRNTGNLLEQAGNRVRGHVGRLRVGAAMMMDNRGLSWNNGELEGLMGNDDVRTGLQALVGDNAEQSAEARTQLMALSESLGSSGGGDHLADLVQRRMGTSGEARAALDAQIRGATALSPEEARAQRAEMDRLSSNFSQGAELLTRTGSVANLEQLRAMRGAGGASSVLSGADAARLAMMEMSEGFAGGGMTRDQLEERSNAVADSMMGLSPEQRSQMLRDASGNEDLSTLVRGQMMNGRRRQQQQRDLSGNGRRRGNGATEEAFNLATGGTFGQMGITDGRGRSITSAAELMRVVEAGGERAEGVMERVQQGFVDMGLTAADADRVVAMSGRDGPRGARSAYDETEIKELQRMGNGDGQRSAAQRAVEQRQRQQNPLDAQRNDLLRTISEGIGKLNIAMSEQSGPGAADKD